MGITMGGNQKVNGFTVQDMLINTTFVFALTIICTLAAFHMTLQHIYIQSLIRTRLQQDPLTLTKKNKLIRQLFIICVISSTLCTWFDCARFVFCYLTDKPLTYLSFRNKIMATADFLYYFALIIFYSIAIYRMQLSFAGTSYELNHCILYFFRILIIVSFILAGFYCSYLFALPVSIEGGFAYYACLIPPICLCIIDFILNTSLLILFISKLKTLLSERLLYCDKNLLLNPKSYVYKSSKDLLVVMTRHTLLFGITIITNQLWFIAQLLKKFIVSNSVDYHVSTYTFRVLSCTVNCIALFFSSEENFDLYKSYCKCCHKALQKCFIPKYADALQPIVKLSINDYDQSELLYPVGTASSSITKKVHAQRNEITKAPNDLR
eukprot:463031_1